MEASDRRAIPPRKLRVSEGRVGDILARCDHTSKSSEIVREASLSKPAGR